MMGTLFSPFLAASLWQLDISTIFSIYWVAIIRKAVIKAYVASHKSNTVPEQAPFGRYKTTLLLCYSYSIYI